MKYTSFKFFISKQKPEDVRAFMTKWKNFFISSNNSIAVPENQIPSLILWAGELWCRFHLPGIISGSQKRYGNRWISIS